MATMGGSKNLTGVANVDLGLTPTGSGFGGDQLKSQLAEEIKKRKKSGLMGQLMTGNSGMQLLAQGGGEG